MVGNGKIGVLRSAFREAGVPKSWMERKGWSSGKQIRIAAGRKSLMATVFPHEKDHLSLSMDILAELKVPNLPMTWKITDKTIRLGPFVAVYCHHHGRFEKPFGSITKLLEDMTAISRELKIPFYVIPIGGFDPDNQTVTGWIYHRKFERWMQSEFPWPDFCIKKIISVPAMLRMIARRESKLISLSRCELLCRPLGSKFNVYQILSKDASLIPHLPETYRFRSLDDLRKLLDSFPIVYIKPSRGTQGKSVYKITRLKGHDKVMVQYREGNLKKQASLRLSENEEWFQSRFLSRREFIVQQGIDLTKDADGRSADFRWLLQKDGHGEWRITARVARLGQKGSVTTNVSTGADVLPCDKFLEMAGFSREMLPSIVKSVDSLAIQIVRILENHAGSLGELGIDLGLDQKGHPWLIEVNPNPGRKMLRVLDPRVRALSLRRPLEYARYTSGFGDVFPD